MVVLTLDVETTTKNKGNVYNPDNKLCSLVIKVTGENVNETIKEYSYPFDSNAIMEYLRAADLLIGFNIKFDLGWLRREFGYVPRFGLRIWDCQYAEYLFSNQTWRFPDLETVCSNKGLGEKFDFIKEKYWNNGIDTDEIPIDELLSYNRQDVEITYQVYQTQIKAFEEEHKDKYKLFKLHMLDLPVLLEMEWNGLKYNVDKSFKKSEEFDTKIKEIENKLNDIAQFPINWNSNPEKAAFLYGGNVSRTIKVPIGLYKTGQKAGQVKYKNIEEITELPQLIAPLKNHQEENRSVAEDVLLSLKPSKHVKNILDLILERAKLEKMNGTYLKGLPKKIKEMNWQDNYLHPSYNQCVTVTGRIASSNPNGQNLAPTAKQLVESRWN